MSKRPRRNHELAFEAKMALEGLKTSRCSLRFRSDNRFIRTRSESGRRDPASEEAGSSDPVSYCVITDSE